jgi:hypothetical protein
MISALGRIFTFSRYSNPPPPSSYFAEAEALDKKHVHSVIGKQKRHTQYTDKKFRHLKAAVV